MASDSTNADQFPTFFVLPPPPAYIIVPLKLQTKLKTEKKKKRILFVHWHFSNTLEKRNPRSNEDCQMLIVVVIYILPLYMPIYTYIYTNAVPVN